MTLDNIPQTSNELRNYFKRWPKFYYFIVDIFGPAYWGGLGPKDFLSKFPSSGKIINVGSGSRRIAEKVINIDPMPFKEVDIVARGDALPFKDNEVARVICDTVLEHVENPSAVIAEIDRVLEKGGYLYVTVPFLYPFHSSPHDFYRWTKEGVHQELNHFDIRMIGVRSGPFSAVTAYLCALVGAIFSLGNERLYWLLVNLSTFLFFPIKYLDIIASHLPFSENMASIFYVVAQKK